jgi:hypothetical protein
MALLFILFSNYVKFILGETKKRDMAFTTSRLS